MFSIYYTIRNNDLWSPRGLYITITLGIKDGISVDITAFKANIFSLRCLKIGVSNEKRCKMFDAIRDGVLDKNAAKEFMITNRISTKEYLEQPGKLPTDDFNPSNMTPETEITQNEVRLALARMMIDAVRNRYLDKKAVQKFIKGPLGYNSTKGGSRRKRPQGSGAVTRRLR